MSTTSPLRKRKLSFASSNGSLSNNSFSYKAKNDDAGTEVHHKAKVLKSAPPLSFETLSNILCPNIRFKYTYPSFVVNWSDNQEKCLETINLHKTMVKDLKKVLVSYSGRGFANFFNGSDLQNNASKLKFTGGKFVYRVMNTCTNTVFLEFREYKMKANKFRDSGYYTTQSPLRLFRQDQRNDVDIGQAGYGVFPLVIDQLSNESSLQDWSISTSIIPDISKGEQISECTLPVGKRPARTSRELRRIYDAGSITKVELRPGQSFIYEVGIDPFFLPATYNMASDMSLDDEIQFYSRMVHMYCRSQFNTHDIDHDGVSAIGPDVTADRGIASNEYNVGSFAPGPGQIHVVKQFDFGCVSIPHSKNNTIVEGCYYAQTLGQGPFNNLDSNNAVHMDADATDVPVGAGAPDQLNPQDLGQVKYNDTS